MAGKVRSSRAGSLAVKTTTSHEELASLVGSMNKSQVKHRLMHFQGPPRLDFTEEYLDGLSADRLRHILLAAMLTHLRH